MQARLLNYHATLQSLINRGDANEHSFRTALENLLNALKPTQDIRIIHEPKSKEGQGNIRPDFKIVRQMPQEKGGYESLVGFIECKNFGADLSPLVKGKQIAKYLSVCHNIILTDYNRFILLSYGKIIDDLVLFDNLDSPQNTPNQAKLIEKSTRFSHLLGAFFDTLVSIKEKDELVKILSTQSFYLSSVIFEAQNTDLPFNQSFGNAFDAFRNLENTAVEPIEFCDILAQSIVYGMFVAHIDSERFDIERLPFGCFASLLPQHFAVLKEFIWFSLPPISLPSPIVYAISNITKAIALIDKPSLAISFQREISEISIYLYEDFLKAYDDLRGEQKRKEGGVFYTPEPIVDMITRSINELLKTHFGKSFSDECVKVLDFATGTGSFLAKVFEIILANQSAVFTKQTIINKCFRDIYGFEISFVPYIVAHLKLSSLLKNKGFSDFSETQKFQIYLTNTLDLDRARDTNHLLVPFMHLKNEREKSLQLKHKEDLLVILGNPPYNVKSKNKGTEILQLLDSYKMGLNEQNIQPLDDDYIKFIRFAQWKLLEQNKNYGIMGFITNNSYLNGRTHRKMRESLAKTFDEIYILNLHGDNSENKNDKNVFDIRVGVCISIFVKYESSPSLAEGDKGGGYNLAQIHYFSTKDNAILRRADKFALLNDIANNGLKTIKWKKLKLDSPYFWFVPKDFSNAEYENFWALAKDKALGESKGIFENFSSGIKTSQDKICISFKKLTMEAIIKDFIDLDCEKIAKKYKIKNSAQWSIETAKADIVANVDCFDSASAESRNDKSPTPSLQGSEATEAIQNKIQKIAHRPFDGRYTFYSGKQGFLGRPRFDTMKHFLNKENLGICFPKTCLNPNFDYGLIIDKIADVALGGTNTGSETYIAPLYCYDSNLNGNSKTPNFTQEFSEFKAKHKVLKSKSPKQILAFIYANLYNPAYRAKYLEYLKIGFPRIDFEISQSKFESLANLGQNLIDLHLMKTIPQDKSIDLVFRANANKSNPNFTLEKPKYEPNQNKIILNADLEIVGVSAEVWDYTIGGYKVLDKWLKYRANDKNGAITLEQSDFTHILNVAKILKATIAIQAKLAEI
ncbi:type ISP restriction/modification enzyme [Helicobacter sp. 23-1044]